MKMKHKVFFILKNKTFKIDVLTFFIIIHDDVTTEYGQTDARLTLEAMLTPIIPNG